MLTLPVGLLLVESLMIVPLGDSFPTELVLSAKVSSWREDLSRYLSIRVFPLPTTSLLVIDSIDAHESYASYTTKEGTNGTRYSH